MRPPLVAFVFLLSASGAASADAGVPSRDVRIGCATDEDCQSYIEASECRDGRCECGNDRLLSSDATKCLPSVDGFGSGCEDNVQCSKALSSGGVCAGGRCRCKAGHHYLGRRCWRSADLGQKCHAKEHCFSAYEYIGLDCDGTCKCRPGYYERLDSGCRRKRNSGESCNLDEDCPRGSQCDRRTCSDSSALQETTTAFNHSIAAAEELGRSCKKDDDCKNFKNAVCLDKACACIPNTYVASEDNRNCLSASLGKVETLTKTSCKEDAQCGVFGGNSFCGNRKCACKDGTYWEKKTRFCWRIRSLNEACLRDEDCHPLERNTKCEDKRCTCQQGHHAKGDLCVPDALKVGDRCEADEECLFPHSFCNSSSVCACKAHHYAENGGCVRGVGSECDAPEDCGHLRNTECKPGDSAGKRCLCLEKHESSVDYRYCLPASDYREACEESFQCQYRLGELGECSAGRVCECVEGAHFSRGRCHSSKFVGDACSGKLDCHPGSDPDSVFCLKGRCACNYDYAPGEDRLCVRTNSGARLQVRPLLLTSFVFVFASSR